MRALMERAVELAETDEDRAALNEAVALDGLHFDLLPPEQTLRLARTVQRAADQLGPEVRLGAEERDREFALRLGDLSLWLTELAGSG
jgi:hypothetical protein